MSSSKTSSVLFIGSISNDEFVLRYQIQESFYEKTMFYICRGIEESITFLEKVPVDWVFINLVDMESDEVVGVNKLLPVLKPSQTFLVGNYNQLENLLDEAFTSDTFIPPHLCSSEFVSKLIAQKEEYTRLFEDFEEHKQIVKKVSEVKNLFLANISHEVRTPLNSILGFSELLEQIFRDDEPIDRADCLQQILLIHQNAKQLHKILHQVIEVSREESNYAFVTKEDFNLHSLITEVIAPYTDCKINIAYLSTADPSKVICYSDPSRIKTVVDALLNNAYKFSENKPIDIRVSFLDVSTKEESKEFSENNLFRIEILDQGVGIAQDDIELIFNRFYQVDENPTRMFSGLGLGLPLAKKLVKELQGDISLQSTIGQGSHFTVEIPMGFKCPIEESVGVKDSPHIEPVDQSTVLVVENNFASRETLRFQLNFLRLDNKTVHSAEESFKLFSDQSFPVVLMDIQMPKIDGFEAMKILQDIAEEKGYTPPVFVAITADARESLREKCLSSGFADLIVKPITLQSLASVLKKYLAITEDNLAS